MKAEVNGTELFFATHGSGLPVMVMHGGLGWDHIYLRPWLDPLGRLQEIRTRTLLITGRDDWITPPAQGVDRMHALLRDSEVAVFEEGGHFPFGEELDRFVALVSSWLKRLE